jgi:hypothetical protein
VSADFVVKNEFHRMYQPVGGEPVRVRVQDYGDLIIYTFPRTDMTGPSPRHFCNGRDANGVPECGYANRLATGG